jgi:hypothetical protein
MRCDTMRADLLLLASADGPSTTREERTSGEMGIGNWTMPGERGRTGPDRTSRKAVYESYADALGALTDSGERYCYWAISTSVGDCFSSVNCSKDVF